HLLVNMVTDGQQAQQVYASMSAILHRFLGYRPGYAGFVITDASVGRAVVEQVPFTLLAPRSGATRCLESFAARLLGARDAVDARGGFWERVTGGHGSE